MKLRPIEEHDWTAIGSVQAACYPPVACEEIASLRCHWLLSPETCLVLADPRSVAGYFLSHPWPRRLLPPLKRLYHSLPEDSDSLFIHDFAILAAERGNRFGDQAVGRILAAAKVMRLSYSTLISVQGTRRFWERHGFTAVPEVTAAFSEELEAFYPEGGCCFMERVL